MQPQKNNPFPFSEKPDKAEHPTKLTPVAPQPSPVATPQAQATATPTPSPAASGSVFILPSHEATQALTPSGPLAGIEKVLIGVFSNPAIQLPDFVRDLIFRFIPWITLMGIFILAPIFLIGIAMGGFLGIITSFYSLNTNVFFWLTLVLLLLKIVLMSLSVSLLLHERRKGWVLLFTSVFVSFVYSITNIFADFLNPIVVIAATVVIAITAFYMLFQIRGYFTK